MEGGGGGLEVTLRHLTLLERERSVGMREGFVGLECNGQICQGPVITPSRIMAFTL